MTQAGDIAPGKAAGAPQAGTGPSGEAPAQPGNGGAGSESWAGSGAGSVVGSDAAQPAGPSASGGWDTGARRPVLLHTAAELGAAQRPQGSERAVVMTMGALHAGHAALIRDARSRVGPDGQVVATVFVNPLQFGPGEDLDRYPRTLEADLQVAAEAGADTVLAPSVSEVYPGGQPQVRVAAGPMGERLEGASRPGHFDGMLTVVAKLLHLTEPDAAFFGEKDAQQLALVRRMVRDLNFPVRIVGVPTVREPDGLALSSRNRYLTAPERDTALALSRALFAARDRLTAQTALHARAAAAGTVAAGAWANRAAALAELGEPRASADAHAVAGAGRSMAQCPSAVRSAARSVLTAAARRSPPLELDYVALVDPADFTEVPEDYTAEAVLAVAARVGSTRLIDNLPLDLSPAPGPGA